MFVAKRGFMDQIIVVVFSCFSHICELRLINAAVIYKFLNSNCIEKVAKD